MGSPKCLVMHQPPAVIPQTGTALRRDQARVEPLGQVAKLVARSAGPEPRSLSYQFEALRQLPVNDEPPGGLPSANLRITSLRDLRPPPYADVCRPGPHTGRDDDGRRRTGWTETTTETASARPAASRAALESSRRTSRLVPTPTPSPLRSGSCPRSRVSIQVSAVSRHQSRERLRQPTNPRSCQAAPAHQGCPRVINAAPASFTAILGGGTEMNERLAQPREITYSQHGQSA